MKTFNLYLTGVGGQGIGLLSEAMLRAADHAGLSVKGVDTHGLAQRGGIVASHLRFGDCVYSPLIQEGEADLVVALERHEAMRGLNQYLKDGGALLYYNTVWQPLEVRLNQAAQISAELISEQCRQRGIKEITVFRDNLQDVRMQNIVVLATVAKRELISGVKPEHYKHALEDLMTGKLLEQNLRLFAEESGAS
jgi:indolepyruvate ferredoxin oxidoreductase beta subunit